MAVMTTDERKPPMPFPAEGVEALARELRERADAADRRSARLDERLALLEGRGARDRPFSQSLYGNFPEPEEDLAGRVLALEGRVDELEENMDSIDEAHSFGGDEPDDRRFDLPESTYTFLITHGPLSAPFAFAAFSISLSIGCLVLTLSSSVHQGAKDNRLGVPGWVDPWVRVAQFVGAIVGVLMEDEIPQGLQLIANAASHTLLLDCQTQCRIYEREVQKSVIVSSVLRLVVGYLYLLSLLVNLVRNDSVVSIFYSVLALDFVENIDDTAFALAKKGFFGRSMLVAANQTHTLRMSEAFHKMFLKRTSTQESFMVQRLSFFGAIASDNQSNSAARLVYFLNAAIVLSGLGRVAADQKSGRYRCNAIDVEEVWERADVALPWDGAFNGIYEAQGSHEDYPKYVQADGGAEIVYCRGIGSWVLAHPAIPVDNECSWLWRSPESQDHDVLSTSLGVWEAWTGGADLAQVRIACVECSGPSDCDRRGTCEDGVCRCDAEHFGDSCDESSSVLSMMSPTT